MSKGGLSLAKSTLPVDGLKGVFTDHRIRKGQYALLTDPQSVRGHDLLGGVGNGGPDGRGTTTLSRWDPIFDMDTSAASDQSGDYQQWRARKLARLVQSQPIRRPLVLFSQERFLAMRHTWTSDRHFTMFMPQTPSVDIVLPATAVELSTQQRHLKAGEASRQENAPSTDDKSRGSSLNRQGTAALTLDSLLPATPSSLGHSAPSTADVLFEVNDPYPCQLPDPDDVANPTYWRRMRQWLADYSHAAAADRSPLLMKGAGGRASLLTPNVQLVKVNSGNSVAGAYGADDDEMMPTLGREEATPASSAQYALVALRDIPADSELFLSYGADWWRQRLLSTLLLSAESPQELGSVRWIERLCASEGQEDDTFPFLVTDKVLVRSNASPTGAVVRNVLWDALRQERAPTQAVIAYTIRQSCLDGDFAGRVMALFAGEGPSAATVMPALRRMVRAYIAERAGQLRYHNNETARV